MYKVQLFFDGTIKTVDKIILVKGLPNELNVGKKKPAQSCSAPSIPNILYSKIEQMNSTLFDEDSIIETAPDDQISELLASVGASTATTDNVFDDGTCISPFVAKIVDPTHMASLQEPMPMLQPQSSSLNL